MDEETPARERDVLAPWGKSGPPGEQWREDILGAPYESRTIPLLPDDEGECVATLVRRVRGGGARFALLYIHGRNDYFFQTELAEHIEAAGGAFYALDLRKYGRSLRPHHTIGFTDDLHVYDEEIGEALSLIRDEVDAPLIVMGHSTGGLIATLWAHRHPGAVSGLILNSAWLEMQSMASWRGAMSPVIGRIAQRSPMWEVPTGGSDFYGRSLVGGWQASGLDLPESVSGPQADPNDPSVVGWSFAHEWKRPESYPVPAAWLEAIMSGHEVVEKEAHVDCPVLSMASTSSYFGDEWDERVFSSDIVLDADVIVERSLGLSDLVTVARFPGKHDLLLSDAPVRARVYATMRAWLDAFI